MRRCVRRNRLPPSILHVVHRSCIQRSKTFTLSTKDIRLTFQLVVKGEVEFPKRRHVHVANQQRALQIFVSLQSISTISPPSSRVTPSHMASTDIPTLSAKARSASSGPIPPPPSTALSVSDGLALSSALNSMTREGGAAGEDRRERYRVEGTVSERGVVVRR